jgi:hypothetical protein
MNDVVHCSARFDAGGVLHEPHEWTGLYQRDVYRCPGGPPPHPDLYAHINALREIPLDDLEDPDGPLFHPEAPR